VAPLKRDLAAGDAGGAADVSTLTKAWPH